MNSVPVGVNLSWAAAAAVAAAAASFGWPLSRQKSANLTEDVTVSKNSDDISTANGGGLKNKQGLTRNVRPSRQLDRISGGTVCSSNFSVRQPAYSPTMTELIGQTLIPLQSE